MAMSDNDYAAGFAAIPQAMRDAMTVRAFADVSVSAQSRIVLAHVASLADDALAAFQCIDDEHATGDRADKFHKVARERLAELLRHIERTHPDAMISPARRQSDRE